MRDSLVPALALFDKAAFAAWRSQTPDADERPIALIPALVVEALSPHARHSEAARKAQRHLALGVQLVWIVDPHVPQAAVYRRGSDQVTLLSPADALTADDLLPDLRLPLDQRFAL
ncbi:MAG: Uma2 family endonuclease [Aggregatilineales bacterium]